MSKLLIQDDIINGMDVYVEYTFDTDETIVMYDYGLELTDSRSGQRRLRASGPRATRRRVQRSQAH